MKDTVSVPELRTGALTPELEAEARQRLEGAGLLYGGAAAYAAAHAWVAPELYLSVMPRAPVNSEGIAFFAWHRMRFALRTEHTNGCFTPSCQRTVFGEWICHVLWRRGDR